MKKLVTLALVLLIVPALAWSFTAPKPGTYQGTITSVVPDLNGKAITADVKTEGTNVTATVTYEGSKEIWTWNDKTLVQKEVDPKTNSVVQEYAATNDNTGKYYVNCKNKATNECDADIDARYFWNLNTTDNSITYIGTGVAKADKGKTDVTPAKRFEFNLKLQGN